MIKRPEEYIIYSDIGYKLYTYTYIYIYNSLPFTIITCTIKNTFYIVLFFIYFPTIPASTLPKPKIDKTIILHRQRHMGVLCKSGPSRVPTRMLAYNKQNK